jgi:hypothetical protein
MKDKLGNHVQIVAVKVDLRYLDAPQDDNQLDNVPLISLAARPGQLCRAICRVIRRGEGCRNG